LTSCCHKFGVNGETKSSERKGEGRVVAIGWSQGKKEERKRGRTEYGGLKGSTSGGARKIGRGWKKIKLGNRGGEFSNIAISLENPNKQKGERM